MKTENKYTTVPVFSSFNSFSNAENPIGELKILTSELPNFPNYCFSLGITIQDKDFNNNITKYRLECLSLASDEEYLTYLSAKKNENNNCRL